MIAQKQAFAALLESIRKNTCNSTLEIQNVNDEMIMQIANAIPENSNLLNLKLSLPGSRTIGTAAIKALIHAIIARTTLGSLDIDSQLEKSGVESIAILLQRSSTLRALYLGSTTEELIGEGDASIGDKGVVVLAQALVQNPKSSLDTFCLRHNRFGKEGTEALANALCKIPSFENLALLNCRIGSKMMGDGGARALVPLFQRSKTLKEVNLDGNDIDNDGVVALIDALNQNQNSNLRIWNLGNNKIRERGVIALATFLTDNPPLEALYLNDNEFREKDSVRVRRPFSRVIIGMVVLFGAMQVLFAAITHAFPARAAAINKLITATLFILGAVFVYARPSLASILKRNKIDTKERAEAEAAGIVELANALTLNATLKILDLSRNYIYDKNAIALARALDPSNPNQRSALESLNLMFTFIGDQSAIAFSNILPRSRLATLNLVANEIGNPGGKALLEALTHDSILNTPLLNLSLVDRVPTNPPDPFQPRNQIDKQIMQRIDSILQRKLEIHTSLQSNWSELSVLIDFYREVDSGNKMRQAVFPALPIIRAFAGFPPRPKITNSTALDPKKTKDSLKISPARESSN